MPEQVNFFFLFFLQETLFLIGFKFVLGKDVW